MRISVQGLTVRTVGTRKTEGRSSLVNKRFITRLKMFRKEMPRSCMDENKARSVIGWLLALGTNLGVLYKGVIFTVSTESSFPHSAYVTLRPLLQLLSHFSHPTMLITVNKFLYFVNVSQPDLFMFVPF